jgi:hypothetical protein
VSDDKKSKKELLIEKKKGIEEKLKKIEAQENAKAKKLDQKRKFIVGEAMIGFFKEDAAFANDLREILKEFVTKPRDREVIADLIKYPSEQTDIEEATNLTTDSSTEEQTTVEVSSAIPGDS